MSNSLKDQISALVADPSVAGIIVEAELQPLAGPSTAIHPATYALPSGSVDKSLRHAYSPQAFVPKASETGWYRENDKVGGVPRLAPRVIVDSVGSQSGRAETALWEGQEKLGFKLPGLVIRGPQEYEAKTLIESQIGAALALTISSWTMPHRHVDAWGRFSDDETGNQVWAATAPDSVKNLITTTSIKTGEQLYQYFINSAIYGFWQSTGTATRHKLPRAYSSEIVGYGAYPSYTGAVKGDAAGGASETSKIAIAASGELQVGVTKNAKKPSTAGFGMVPSEVEVSGYICEVILQQASINISVFRSIQFGSPAVKQAALTVLTIMAMTGHALGNQDGFLRSHCSLVVANERWGYMQRGSVNPVTIEVNSPDELIEALNEAIADAESLGLKFKEPIELTFSAAERQLIQEAVIAANAKQSAE